MNCITIIYFALNQFVVYEDLTAKFYTKLFRIEDENITKFNLKIT